jgi:hypothetical protein
MTREAKLYILEHKDWELLADKFIYHQDAALQIDVSIFKIGPKSTTTHSYAIITLSDKADSIVEEYGAILVGKKDLLRNTLHNYSETLFGDISNLDFLERVQ